MASLVARITSPIARYAFTFRLACLVAFIAALASWKQRKYLLAIINRLFSARSKPVIIFAIGNPSTDKDIFIANLSRDFNLQHISVEAWLSSLRERQDQIGALARKHWEKQIPLPASHLVPLLRAHVNELRDFRGARQFLIDGFPRTKESAVFWYRKVGKPNMTICFDTPKRRAFAQHASIVRKRFDSLGAEDERKLVEQRFEEHESESNGLLEYLSQGNRVIQITVPDDSNKSYAKVLDTLRNHPKSALVFK